MDVEKFIEKCRENEKKMEALDDKAKAEGKMVGRYVREQIADGYAYYVIVKENKKTVVVEQVRGIGDDYQVPYWGSKASIKKEFAAESIRCRDTMNEFFAKQRKEKG